MKPSENPVLLSRAILLEHFMLSANKYWQMLKAKLKEN